jgi:hypothetical protein
MGFWGAMGPVPFRGPARHSTAHNWFTLDHTYPSSWVAPYWGSCKVVGGHYMGVNSLILPYR